jgi:hypothetical protein
MQYDFSKQVQAIVEKTKVRMDIVVRKLCLDMFSDIMIASPVLTGAFRGNWMLSVGQPVFSADKTKTLKEDNAALEATNAAVAGMGKEAIGSVIYWTNSMPYAYRLEHGWSKKAPNGMVAVTVAAWQSHLQRALGV